MRKIAIATVALAIAGTFTAAAVPFANAQLFIYGAATTTATSSIADTSSTTTGATTTATSSTSSTSSSSLPLPTPVISTSLPSTAGFIQFNGLVINSVDSATVPTVILAANPEFSTSNPATPGVMDASCEWYTTEFSNVGTAIACPLPPVANTTTTTTSTSTPSYGSFQIDVTGTTQLLLNDRTTATLANIMPGDTINVFGYYDGVDTIQADVLRDLSQSAVDASAAGNGTSIADIQNEIEQIEVLITQLIAQVNGLASTTSTGAGGPMIPYNPSSTIPIATATITFPPTGTIY